MRSILWAILWCRIGFWSTTEDSLPSATGDLWWDSLSRSQGLGPSRWRNVGAMGVKWQARRIAMLFTSLHKCWLKNCWQYDLYLMLSSWHDGQWLLCVECSIVWCCAARILTTWKRSSNGHWYSLIAFVRSSMRSEWKDNMKSVLRAYCKIIAEHCPSYWYTKDCKFNLPIYSQLIIPLRFCTARSYLETPKR